MISKDWGHLKWFANENLGNSGDMTFGMCVLKPGKANPKHSHPNCAEILHVLQGTILHSYENDTDIELNEGDTIVLPENFKHRAKNIGQKEAVLMIAFSSGNRKTEGE